ncbi:MAG: YifB family Mg chelatase-like AAA ATPase [Holosporales bacterium]|jgi:magnesium chelatase family protein|nr:YifB family Mg chelatase-like AAA ATPase [Holosporales bacterium]
MITKIRTVAFVGMKPIEIIVEAQISPGISSFSIVGLPDKAVGEAKERIRSTFFQIGLSFPSKRVVVNMAPADIPKSGSHYDLPIALSILGAMDVIDANMLDNTISIGELGLDGNLSYVFGTICAAMLANENGFSIICPKQCEKEALWSGNNSIIAAKSILSIINHLKGISQITASEDNLLKRKDFEYDIDICEVYGQNVAKRALEIAACGGHNVLMIGSPGSGKSMLAERAKTILPELSPEESLETTCIYSMAGMAPENGLVYIPPFRAPHSSSSLISIVGGGADAKPGELSLSHNGILFLDEFPEFPRSIIESLRQPLETNNITISRAKEHITYPANIQLIAAMNPCKCGFFGNADKECLKAPKCALEYRNRISGPILDRFDIVVYMSNIKASNLFENEKRERSKEIKDRIKIVRDTQIQRANKNSIVKFKLNGKIQNNFLNSITKLDSDSKAFFQKAVEHSNLSARGCHKILRVARTIADMETSENVLKHHVLEALQYKLLDIKGT